MASVKPTGTRDDFRGFKRENDKTRNATIGVEHRRLTATNLNLFSLIIRAHGIRGCRPLGGGDCPLISGGPDWLKRDGFDIQATMPGDSPHYTDVQFVRGHAPQLQLMLQALLADRFGPGFIARQGSAARSRSRSPKKGLKLNNAAEGEQSKLFFRPSVQANGVGTVQFMGRNTSIQEVVETLSIFLERPVLDRTGLKGGFDFTLNYAADPDAPGPFTSVAGPALFTALQEQAGLKLESTKAPVEVLVIDYVQQPSEN